jgi:alkanesulfonate monooxygenase SsuD/methylene tetrahydromethanopterin reductase-like flavin-dependent oxidoreductase (luciferase family)
VGGTPQSAIRAARYGLPLMIALVGGQPRRVVPLVELYRRALEQSGRLPLPVGLHTIGYVGKSDEDAVRIQYPFWAEMMEQSAGERGWAPPSMARFQADIHHGSLLVGSPDTVAARLAAMIRLLGLSRFDLAYALGRVPHEQRLETIELYGREVIPRVRELLAAPAAAGS